MMSSKRAATKILWEFLSLVEKQFRGREIVFKSYAQMELGTIPRWSYHRKLARFEKHGLIKRTVSKQGSIFVITPKAKKLRRKAVAKVSRGDGSSTLVLFDIPEAKHNARDTLRRYLIRSGYTQMRESCFLSPFEVSEDLKDLIDELKLRENISFFSAKSQYPF